MIQAESVLTIPWATVAAIVSPIVGGGVFVVRWIINRSDKDRESLEKRMDEDRRVLAESLNVLRNSVEVTNNDMRENRSTMRQLSETQIRITTAQERISANLELLSGILVAGDRQAFAHNKDR
jgi:hypothetical protein